MAGMIQVAMDNVWVSAQMRDALAAFRGAARIENVADLRSDGLFLRAKAADGTDVSFHVPPEHWDYVSPR